MAEKPNIQELVKKMPDVDGKEGKEGLVTAKFTGPPPDQAEEVYTAILAGGKGSLVELIGMLKDHTDPEFKDFRPEYVLHGIAIYAGRKENREIRETVADTLVSELDNDDHPTAVKALLMRELQVVGGPKAVRPLGKFLTDADLCESAAQAMVAIRQGAAAELRRALRNAKGACRLTVVQNLGVLRDEDAIRGLQRATRDVETDTRLAAVWGLAQIGDAGSVDVVLKAADAEPGWERIQATKACLVLAENLQAAGKKSEAQKIYKSLRDSRTDESEKYIRNLAEKALEAAG